MNDDYEVVLRREVRDMGGWQECFFVFEGNGKRIEINNGGWHSHPTKTITRVAVEALYSVVEAT